MKSYSNESEEEVSYVGLVENHGAVASPDGFVGNNGLLEIKCVNRYDHWKAIKCLSSAKSPIAYKAQVMGQMWVCERDYCDLLFYYPDRLPCAQFRLYRDEKYIKLLAKGIEECLKLKEQHLEDIKYILDK